MDIKGLHDTIKEYTPNEDDYAIHDNVEYYNHLLDLNETLKDMKFTSTQKKQLQELDFVDIEDIISWAEDNKADYNLEWRDAYEKAIKDYLANQIL